MISSFLWVASEFEIYIMPNLFCLLLKKGSSFQSALFNFQSLLTVVLLLICTCAYVRALAPRMLDKNKEGYVEMRTHWHRNIVLEHFSY